MSRAEIVIARHREDISWAEGQPAVIYNKGPAVASSARQMLLPNVGREAHTYLHHIIHSWEDLADTTVFTQAGLDHIPPGIRFDRFFDPSAHLVVPRVVRCREWGVDGRIIHFGIWKQKMDHGQMSAGRLSLVAWFRDYLGVNIEELGSVVYAPGAVFSVTRECIKRRPLGFYQALAETVAHHNDPEEAHYLERAWLYVFGWWGAKVRPLSN